MLWVVDYNPPSHVANVATTKELKQKLEFIMFDVAKNGHPNTQNMVA